MSVCFIVPTTYNNKISTKRSRRKNKYIYSAKKKRFILPGLLFFIDCERKTTRTGNIGPNHWTYLDFLKN